MSDILKLWLCVGAFILFGLIVFLLRRNSMVIKYSIMWMVLPLIMILMVIFSEPLAVLAHLLGFNLLSNFVMVVVGGCLLLYSFALTIMINTRRNQIASLTQEVAILKKKIEDLKNER